jgi:hypothetical protein
MPEFKIETPSDIDRAFVWADGLITKALQAGTVVMELRRETRTKEQNDKAWPMFRDFEPIIFMGKKWKSEEWKCFLVSAFNNEVPATGLRGEPVSLGLSTSKVGKRRFSDFIEFIYAEGSEMGVKWSEPSLAYYEEMIT